MHSSELLSIACGHGELAALLLRPADAACLYVFAHGAGAGMRSAAMEETVQALADQRIATLRYDFPYMERGKGAPDAKPVLMNAVRCAVAAARDAAPTLPLLAGGRSMGGRITSMAAAQAELPGVLGIVFYAFPLHPAGKPGIERAAHLADVGIPMLFLQGSRDALAELFLLRPVIAALEGNADIYVVEEADHSFRVPKRTGKTIAGIAAELASKVREWADSLAASKSLRSASIQP